MKFVWRNIIILMIPLLILGAGCGGSSAAEVLASKPVKITIWRVFDDSDTFQSIMSAYQSIHPNV